MVFFEVRFFGHFFSILSLTILPLRYERKLPQYWVSFYDQNLSSLRLGRYRDFHHVTDLEERAFLRNMTAILDGPMNERDDAVDQLESKFLNGSAESGFLLCMVAHFRLVENLPSEKEEHYLSLCNRNDTILGTERSITQGRNWDLITENSSLIYSRFAKATDTNDPTDFAKAISQTHPFSLSLYDVEELDYDMVWRLKKQGLDNSELFETIQNRSALFEGFMEWYGLGTPLDRESAWNRLRPVPDEISSPLQLCYFSDAINVPNFPVSREARHALGLLHATFPEIETYCPDTGFEVIDDSIANESLVCLRIQESLKTAFEGRDHFFIERMLSFGLSCGMPSSIDKLNGSWWEEFVGDDIGLVRLAWMVQENATQALRLLELHKVAHPSNIVAVLFIQAAVVLRALWYDLEWRREFLAQNEVFLDIFACYVGLTVLFVARSAYVKRMAARKLPKF